MTNGVEWFKWFGSRGISWARMENGDRYLGFWKRWVCDGGHFRGWVRRFKVWRGTKHTKETP